MWWLRIGRVGRPCRVLPRPQYVRRPYWGPTSPGWELTRCNLMRPQVPARCNSGDFHVDLGWKKRPIHTHPVLVEYDRECNCASVADNRWVFHAGGAYLGKTIDLPDGTLGKNCERNILEYSSWDSSCGIKGGQRSTGVESKFLKSRKYKCSLKWCILIFDIDNTLLSDANEKREADLFSEVYWRRRNNLWMGD